MADILSEGIRLMAEQNNLSGFDREELILSFHEEIQSTPEEVDRLVQRLCDAAREMECAPGEMDKVELALQEALNNAVLHAHKGDPGKRITVSCLCQEDKGLLLVVHDSGPGFDVNNIPDPTNATNIYSAHGRGIFLIKQLMDEVEFQDGGRSVIMKKNGKKSIS